MIISPCVALQPTSRSVSLCSAVRRWRTCKVKCLRRRSCVLWWRDVWWRTRWRGRGFTPSWWRTIEWHRTCIPHWPKPGAAVLSCSPASLLMATDVFTPMWMKEQKMRPVRKVRWSLYMFFMNEQHLTFTELKKTNCNAVFCSCRWADRPQVCRATEGVGFLWRRTGWDYVMPVIKGVVPVFKTVTEVLFLLVVF